MVDPTGTADLSDIPDPESAQGTEGTDEIGAPVVLTPRQRKVLRYIRESVAKRGYPPSVREIGDAVGLKSPSSVAHQLNALERKGL
ncbi:MAG: repressor LexA, partial [Nakamurella sp.]